jgi:hypothetical protein
MSDQEMTQMDVVRSLRNLPLPMPKNLSQTFDLLGLYDPAQGIEKLLSRVDVRGVRPKQVYNAVLRRPPDNLDMALPPPGYDARRHFEAAIGAPEFQRALMHNYLEIFADKHRDIFIHIPKCAGTDLVLNLAPGRLSFPKVLIHGEWVSPDEFLTAVSGLVQAARFYSQIFIYGHMQVGEYFDIAGVRTSDRIFTVIRDPVDLLLSQANYAAGRLRQDPEGHSPDTRDILTALGKDRLREDLTPQYLKRLAARCLLNRVISQPNRICYYLGKEQTPSYRRAIEHIVTFDIEVTETSRYSKWLDERWGLQVTSRHNESEKLLTSQEARRFFGPQVQAATAEDQKLFNVIDWVLRQTGRSSTRGSEIAEIAGSDLLTALPARLAKERRARAISVVAVQSDELIQQLDAPVSGELTDATLEVVQQYNFGEDGNGAEVTGPGWSMPEANFTWTEASDAIIDLPVPRIPGHYVLHIRCSPFLVEDIVLSQRVTILVNGRELRSLRLQDITVLDFDLPWLALADCDTLKIAFELPDAVRPCDVASGTDGRLLGIALQTLTLFRLTDTPANGEGRTPPELSDLALAFESLGENCEFGLVQRRFGAEPLGLLRFSSAPLPKLLAALEARFEGLGNPKNIEVQVSEGGTEYMVLDTRFGFLYHAWVAVGEQTPEAIAVRESRRLPLLVRKLTEDLTIGEKIFVFHGMEPLALEEAQRLSAVLREYGPSTLLWVELADEEHAPGTVERIQPGLLKGYMDRFAPGENAHDLSLDCWITLCRNAYRTWRPLQ